MSSSAPAAVQTRYAHASWWAQWTDRVEGWLAVERHQLVLFTPICMGAGIGAWFALPTVVSWIAALAVAIAIALLACLLNGLTRAVVTGGSLLFAFGLAIAWSHAERVAAPVLGDQRFGLTFSAEVLRVEPMPARDRTRLYLRPRSELSADLTVRINVRSELPEGIGTGAIITTRATLSPPAGPSVPGGYHFARRAWFEGIGATGYTLGPVELVRSAPPPTGFAAWLADFRTELTFALQQGVGGRAGGVAAALVTGDRGGIEPDVTEAMRDSGLAHLIAISGLHIAVVVGGTMWIVRRLLLLSSRLTLRVDVRLIAAGAAALAGIAYTLIAGAGVPTVRACIAVLLVLLGLAAGREAISLRLVAVGATLILIWRPDYLLSPSFQLSFAAVTGIVALYQSPWGRRWSAPHEDAGWIRKLWRGAVALFLTGIIAELAIGPIALYHFNQMGLYGAAANLIAIPLTTFIIIPLLILAVLTIPLGLAAPAFAGLHIAIGELIALAETTSALPGAVILLPAISRSAFAVFVLSAAWICLWQTRRRWYGLTGVALAMLMAFAAARPDILVGPDGRHLAVRTASGELYMLRPRVGEYISDMWGAAAGSSSSNVVDDLPATACSRDACTLVLDGGERNWRIFATRSRDLIARPEMENACTTADIVVSDRRLPNWCRPRWLRLGRTELDRLGALSIDLSGPTVRAAAAEDGDHPWARHLRRQ
ncbi:MAG: ComEC/Rec2 family competence protein [Pacificimonas sp.]